MATTQAPPGGLEITDSRTGKSYNLPITDGAIRANDLKKISTGEEDDPGLLSYDPAFLNTASCRSAITFIDGDKGILRYRGYPIEQLAEDSSFLEVAWLLRHGELPSQQEYDSFVHDITYHTYVHENMRKFLEGFRYDAHPMAMLNSAVAALASFYPSSRNIMDPVERNISIIRLLAKVPTIAAFCYRHLKGLPFVYPDNDLSYVDNFLSMVARMTEPKYNANPTFSKALEILFILHADHEQNCSTSAVRAVGSSHVDPFSAMSAGIAALFGPLHGGANEQVLRMIQEIGTVKNVPKFIEEVKSGKGGRLMGFGHRVYKSYDPRAKIVKKLADDVFKVVGVDKDLEIAVSTRIWRLRWSSSASRSPMTTSSRASSTRTSISIRGSSTGRWRFRRTSSPCCSRLPARLAGSRSGRRCSSTRSRRSPGRVRYTLGRMRGRTSGQSSTGTMLRRGRRTH